MKMLTILIPTRNRSEKIKLQARTILDKTKLYEEFIQIIVSDNSDIPLKRSDIDGRIRIIRASQRFQTFEEHFFWAIKNVQSEFVWTLGDDDDPQTETIDYLMNQLFEDDHDIIMFNGWRENKKKELIQMIPCAETQIEVPYKEFLMSAGIWGVGAGISLCIFRKSCIKDVYLSEIEKIGSPIYSHVVLFLRCFHEGKFIFLNLPLVSYRRSDPEAQFKRSGNWENYAINTQQFYRYPWTLGFLKQISYLAESHTLGESEIYRTLEFDENAKRYFLLDSLQMMLIEELDDTFFSAKKSKIQMSESDLKYLVTNGIVIQVLSPELIDVIKEIETRSIKQSKSLVRKFQYFKSTNHGRMNNYEKRLPTQKYVGYSEFTTPNGIVAIHDRYSKFNNIILSLACSSVGSSAIRRLPDFKDKSNSIARKIHVIQDIKIFIFLMKHSAGRRFIEERIYIFFRGLYIRTGLKRKPNLNLKFRIHAVTWKLISVLWIKLPFPFRKFLKENLKR